MSDEAQPDFTVVDRRRASQPPSEFEPAPAEETANAAPERAEGAASETGEAPDMSALADPGILLSLAAMQLEAKTLSTALIPIFDAYAWRAMGLIADPRTGESKLDLAAAQLAIDCIQFLLSKVENEMSEPERREAQRRLSDLRLNYVAKRQAT